MGVIYVVAEAEKLGYHSENPDWVNLGQGMPEVGPLPGAPPRVSRVEIEPRDHAYGPVAGIRELREAVADLYNAWFRKGKRSRYAPENVAISAGGRLGLLRAVWALGEPNLGYFTPDYPAYEDYLTGVPRVSPVHIPLAAEDGFAIEPAALAREVEARGLGALLVSNPCNPTGRVVRDRELAAWVGLARERGVTLLLDEFYSHYVWDGAAPVSAAAHVEDVDEDGAVIVDGLTKGYRYPGWRIGWTLGPRKVIETLTRSGSAVDGGPPRWLQKAVIPLVEPVRARRETDATRAAFRPKRDLTVERLRGMGLRMPREPEGTFYAWASVEDLPPPLDDGFSFFRAALERKVMTVPGVFFDVNPGKRRPGTSRLRQYLRFSYGAPIDAVRKGLDRLGEMVAEAGRGQGRAGRRPRAGAGARR